MSMTFDKRMSKCLRPENNFILKYSYDELIKKSEKPKNLLYEPKWRIVLSSIMEFQKRVDPSKIKKIEYSLEEGVEKNLFIAIDRAVHRTLHRRRKDEKCETCNKYSSQSGSKNSCETGYNNLEKLIDKLKDKNKFLEFVAIKGIIISMINLMRDLINDILREPEKININIFVRIYDQFVTMSNYCPSLEKDFGGSLEAFKDKYQFSFSLSELFGDIFWDSIFQVGELTSLFIRAREIPDINDETERALSKIVDALWKISYPLKHHICGLLGIFQLTGEKDLVSFIKEQKEKSSNYEKPRINPENPTQKEVQNKIGLQRKNLLNESQKGFNKLSKEIQKKQKNTKNESDNMTIDDLYNYIINDNVDEKRSSNRKKNKKKKRKNTLGTEDNNSAEDNNNTTISSNNDPVVDQFKTELCMSVKNAGEIQKLKPIISDEWLKHISCEEI